MREKPNINTVTSLYQHAHTNSVLTGQSYTLPPHQHTSRQLLFPKLSPDAASLVTADKEFTKVSILSMTQW